MLARFSIAGVPHNGIRIVSSSNWLASDALAGGKLGRGHRLPPYPGAVPSVAYKVAGDGQPVFVHTFLTYDQFNSMDYASFSMTGKVRVTVTMLVSERKVLTCQIRPLAYGIQPRISGNTVSFELDRPRYLVLFFNDEPAFNNTGLMLFAEPPEKNPPKPGDANVVNIRDYKVDSAGKTVETAKINQAIHCCSN